MPTWIAVVLGLVAAAGGVLALARVALVLVTVFGPSMTPALEHGDRVLLVRRWLRPVRRGDIVAARFDPEVAARFDPGAAESAGQPGAGDGSWIVKRAVALGGDPVPQDHGRTVARGSVYLLGDNAAASDDSRIWGGLPVRAVVGVVVRRLPRRG